MKATNWLRENPHRIHLGMIGLQILKEDGSEITIKDIKDNLQKLDLWTGEITSSFTVEGVPVKVTTVCHPGNDQISAKIESELIRKGRLKVKIHFPLGIPLPAGYDFDHPDEHITNVLSSNDSETLFERIQDNDRYFVKVKHANGSVEDASRHLYYIKPDEEIVI